MLKADGFDKAVIGKTYDVAVQESRLVYSVNKCIEILIKKDGINYHDARSCMENIMCAQVDQSQPIFLDAEEFETIEDLCEDE
mgnify:CR=1 FL=1|jgi:hypothetical protein|tara:strand:- start:139 stop:387 length:249 start_codon:yes stop_codon:yes gene_type:complete